MSAATHVCMACGRESGAPVLGRCECGHRNLWRPLLEVDGILDPAALPAGAERVARFGAWLLVGLSALVFLAVVVRG